MNKPIDGIQIFMWFCIVFCLIGVGLLFVPASPKDLVSEAQAEEIRRLVNESIKCFEMPEEEINQTEPPEPPVPPQEQKSPQDQYVYYVSYFYDGNQGAAQIIRSRPIFDWSDLYTSEDCVKAKIMEISPGMKSLIIIQFTLLRHIPAQGL